MRDIPTLLKYFKTMANENRLKIVGLVAHQERSVEELAALLNLRSPTVSHHLNKLKALNIVTMRREGNTHLYHFSQPTLRQMTINLFAPDNMSMLTKDIKQETWEEKVLESFIKEGSLQRLPAGLKKRMVVLRWLVDHFDQGNQYTEKEVNEIINRYHPDYATIRREFIDNGLMQRNKGIYWRLPDPETKTN